VQEAAGRKKEELLQALSVLAPAIQVHAIGAANRQSAGIVQTIHNAAAEAECQRGEILVQQGGFFAAIAEQGRKNLKEMTAQNEHILTDVNKGFDETRKQIAEESRRTMEQLLATRQEVAVGFVQNGKFHEKTHFKIDELSNDQQAKFQIMISMLATLMNHCGAQSRVEDVRLEPSD
jgi:hypothetical protein